MRCSPPVAQPRAADGGGALRRDRPLRNDDRYRCPPLLRWPWRQCYAGEPNEDNSIQGHGENIHFNAIEIQQTGADTRITQRIHCAARAWSSFDPRAPRNAAFTSSAG